MRKKKCSLCLKLRASLLASVAMATCSYHATWCGVGNCKPLSSTLLLESHVTITRMKYPLSIINKLLDVYGSDICVGYDIACSFTATLKSSSLGPRATAARLRCVVPAFHGYAHSRSCQVKWHPLLVEGTGKEDFEGSERAFSASNSLAVGTRLSSRFHHAQAIQQHWLFWSMDKHAQSGKVITTSLCCNFLTPSRNIYPQQLQTSRDHYPRSYAGAHAVFYPNWSHPSRPQPFHH